MRTPTSFDRLVDENKLDMPQRNQIIHTSIFMFLSLYYIQYTPLSCSEMRVIHHFLHGSVFLVSKTHKIDVFKRNRFIPFSRMIVHKMHFPEHVNVLY